VRGLSVTQVRDRRTRGLVNRMPDDTGRSFARILSSNVFTVFNAIVGGSFVLLLVLGAWQDALFGIFAITNTVIGVAQEFRAKWVLSRLSVLTAPRALVRRDGADVECAVADVVMDDILVLRPGEQIAADAMVIERHELEIDESLLTGEADPIAAIVGRELLSGSHVVAGTGLARVTRVGADSYAARITSEARRFALVDSELRRSIGRVIRWLSILLIPVAAVVVNGQMQAAGGWAAALSGAGWHDVAIASTASVIAMVPAGLVFLSSAALGVGAVRLAKNAVLVRELAAVEGLARVDMLCIDKTGTLTEGAMAFDRVEVVGAPAPGWERALGWLANDPAANATARAIAERFTSSGHPPTRAVPFSSRHKWSAVRFTADGSAGTWVLGGADVVLTMSPEAAETRSRAAALAATGARTLVLAHSTRGLPETAGLDPSLPDGLHPVALIVLRERVRADAARIIRYFQEQGVEICVLSGDEPRTVASIARAAGLPADLRSVDARTLGDDPDAVADALRHARVFGRVTPEQKKAMILALRSSGHTVAMIGDGVNDTLALKHADLAIAMGTGSGAARGVAQVVLLDGDFAHLPQVVAEGRRVIANVERLARVFLTKTVYAIVFAIAFGLLLLPFPFLPRQLSVVDGLTIGLPALVLGFLPNASAYRPGFLRRTVRFCVPSGLIVAASVLAVVLIALRAGVPPAQVQTAAVITLTLSALWVLAILARPFTRLTAALGGGGYLGLLLVLSVPLSRTFLVLELPPADVTAAALVASCAASVLLELVHRLGRTGSPLRTA
jgi:cation-transporting ATPase E